MKVLATAAMVLALATLSASPVAAKSLSSKDRARVQRAPPDERDAVERCLRNKNKGSKTGAIAGAAGGAGVGLIAGGNVGETALAAGAGALAGHLIGQGSSTNETCDEILKRNK